MKVNHKLIEYISTYKTLCLDQMIDSAVSEKIIVKIINLVENTPMINYSAFCAYLQVLGYSYNTYMNEKNNMNQLDKRNIMKQFLDYYIAYRHDLYLSHGYSDLILQVNSDMSSSRRKGKTGIEKVESFLVSLDFQKANSIQTLLSTKLCYILPDKGQLDIFNNFLEVNNVKFEFRSINDFKNPDFLIKINNEIFIVEHKLTNGSGGSQNAEINELIRFISFAEVSKNVHYVSCLAGNYFRKFSSAKKEPKVISQYTNLVNILDKNKHNYFLNSQGFQKLIKDFIK